MKGKIKVQQNVNIAIPIKEFPNYAITTSGDVYSFAQNEMRLLKPRKTTQNSRYLQVSLYNDKCKRDKKGRLLPEQCYIHRLVYETFVGEIFEGLEIDHIDGDPSNNHLSNLRLITKEENVSKGRMRRWGYSVWEAQDEMIKLHKKGMTQTEIARLYGFSISSVWRVVNNKRQRLKNGKYYYDEKN